MRELAGISGHSCPHGGAGAGVVADKAVHEIEAGVAPHTWGGYAVDADLGDDGLVVFDAIHSGEFNVLEFVVLQDLAGVGDFFFAIYFALALAAAGGVLLLALWGGLGGKGGGSENGGG